MCDNHEKEQKLQRIMDELRRPFHPSQVEWKPGAVKGDRAMALAYADLRVYMNRLDEVCGSDWSLTYEPWGDERIIATLTICGVSRSSTGEMNKESERSEIGGTVAEAQAAKRACAMWGLSRYLYNLQSPWADFDPATKRFTDGAKAKLNTMLTQHYREAMKGVQNTPTATQQAAMPVSGANGHSDTTEPPTDEELAVISQWANRTEAEMWAVMVGACKNEYEATNSMNKSIAKCGGKVTKENYICVYVDFLRHQQEELAHQPHPQRYGNLPGDYFTPSY